ncbi:MAG: RNA polymerase sigma-70 factor (ECF subfamily) [Clostridium sp.]|jgi:RNA polymerase sigma-70 factor (ECF subfamily)
MVLLKQNPFYYRLLFRVGVRYVPIVSLVQKDSKEKKDIHSEIERLINCYGDDVLRVAYLYVKDMHKAEDIFQEVFIKIFKKYDSFKGNSSEKTWIMRITVNVCKDYFKSFWIKRVLLNSDRDEDREIYNEEYNAQSLDDNIIKAIESRELLHQVMNLTIKYKEVIILYYYEEFNTREISEMLKLPEGTVRTRLFRGRKLLKKNVTGRIEYDG